MQALPLDIDFTIPPSRATAATSILDLTFRAWGVRLKLLVRSNGILVAADIRGSRWAVAIGKVK